MIKVSKIQGTTQFGKIALATFQKVFDSVAYSLAQYLLLIESESC